MPPLIPPASIAHRTAPQPAPHPPSLEGQSRRTDRVLPNPDRSCATYSLCLQSLRCALQRRICFWSAAPRTTDDRWAGCQVGGVPGADNCEWGPLWQRNSRGVSRLKNRTAFDLPCAFCPPGWSTSACDRSLSGRPPSEPPRAKATLSPRPMAGASGPVT